MVLLAGIQVLRLGLGKLQKRDRADEGPAVFEDVHPRPALVVELETVVALHPAGDALVVAGHEVDPEARRGLGHALAAACVPDGGVGHALDPPPPEPGVLPLDAGDLLKLLIRRPAHALVGGIGAAVELEDAVQHPLVVERPPRAGEGLSVAEVVAPKQGPAPPRPGAHIQRRDHMAPSPLGLQLFPRQLAAVLRGRLHVRLDAEILKELSLEDVPASVEPSLSELRRQALELLQVVRVFLHECPVVRDQGLDEAVLVRLLALAKAPVEKEALDPGVALAAGIAGVVDALGKVVGASDAGA